MDTTLKVIFLIWAVIMIVLAISGIKNEVTFEMRMKITNAIFAYQMDNITKHNWDADMVGYSDMESYDATMHRIWDWGYTRILPPEKFELIKPFIK